MKSQMYFIFAAYYRFFAKIVLSRWKPRILAVTGTAGKTSALNLLSTALKTKYSVYVSKKANSAIGISYSILGIVPVNYSVSEFIWFFVSAPFRCMYLLIVKRDENIFVVELDVDRPGEMAFMSAFIHPEVVYWVSSYAMHTESFAPLVAKGMYPDEVTAMSHEYSKIMNNASTLPPNLIVAADNTYIRGALEGLKPRPVYIDEATIQSWTLGVKRTTFDIKIKRENFSFTIDRIAQKNFGYTVSAVCIIGEYFGIDRQTILNVIRSYSFPPGRATILAGVHNTTLIDSSYNSSFEACKGMLELLATYMRRRKIAVLGDMRELGRLSQSEHERLAQEIVSYAINQVVLVGPNMQKYVFPYLLSHGYTNETVHYFSNSYQAGVFIKERLSQDGDIILLKASQNTLFFEIIAEMMLENKEDVSKLCRREKVWELKRQQIIHDFYRQIHQVK
ncbi:MAG: hypothetical protein NUV65_01935 [Candidatus Roizmanbacteria bacterium]|nr:hypothetical protein [Candidatus Roizmanbacteria bacterium]